MRGFITVVSADEFKKWMDEQLATSADPFK
jgi:heme/copper-type cytochrome/quinol oxidase subunit 2